MTTFYPAVTDVKGTYIVAGSFAPNGTSAVDNTSNNPTGKFTVARTGPGVFTVTLTETPNNILYVDAKYRGATASLITPVINSYVSTTGVITITCIDVDAAAALVDAGGDALVLAAAHTSDAATDLATAAADTTWDSGTASAANDSSTDLTASSVDYDDAGDQLIAGAAAFTAAADVTAAAGTRIEFIAICENSYIPTKEIV